MRDGLHVELRAGVAVLSDCVGEEYKRTRIDGLAKQNRDRRDSNSPSKGKDIARG